MSFQNLWRERGNNPNMAVTKKIRCRVGKIIDHGEHVYSVTFIPDRSVPRFRPGQFLHLALDEYNPSSFWPDSRVFSIASSPLQRDKIKISYSVVGKFTARMEQELAYGKTVWIKLPYGNFIVQGNRNTVLFAGGTGITAFTAYLSSLTGALSHNVSLFYGAKNPNLLIFRKMIQEKTELTPNFKATYFIEHGADRKSDDIKGRISVEKAWSLTKHPRDSDYYISGPPKMVKTLLANLENKGISKKSIHVDAWE